MMIDDDEFSTVGDRLSNIAEGGLLRLLTGKVVEQALGRLISGLVSVPTAYLENWAQRKRNDTLAERRIASAIASEVKAVVTKDDDIIQRGTKRWTEKILGRQKSVEDVAARTLTILVEDGELPSEAKPPTEEFMRTFEDMAEKASTEAVADLLARVLAGEIRKPGSVSRRTLRVIDVIDQDVAEGLKTVLPYMLNSGVIVLPRQVITQLGQKLALLSSLSIIPDFALCSFTPDSTDQAAFEIGQMGIVLTAPDSAKFSVSFTGMQLTPIGLELAAILPWANDRNVNGVAQAFSEIGAVTKVEVGKLVAEHGGFRVIDLVEYVDLS